MIDELARKPPQTVREYLDRVKGQKFGDDLLDRYLELRRRGLVMPIVCAASSRPGYYIATSYLEMWKNKRYVSPAQMLEEIEAIEVDIRREVA